MGHDRAETEGLDSSVVSLLLLFSVVLVKAALRHDIKGRLLKDKYGFLQEAAQGGGCEAAAAAQVHQRLHRRCGGGREGQEGPGKNQVGVSLP